MKPETTWKQAKKYICKQKKYLQDAVRSFHVEWFVEDNDDDVIIRLIRIIIAIWLSLHKRQKM